MNGTLVCKGACCLPVIGKQQPSLKSRAPVLPADGRAEVESTVECGVAHKADEIVDGEVKGYANHCSAQKVLDELRIPAYPPAQTCRLEVRSDCCPKLLIDTYFDIIFQPFIDAKPYLHHCIPRETLLQHIETPSPKPKP